MQKIYYLSTCSTCKRIMKELNIDNNWIKQDIKLEPVTKEQLEFLHQHTDSYEALFSKRSMQYKAMGLKDKVLKEADYKDLILKEYTFLKRPVIIVNDQIFVGNAPKTIEAANKAING